MAILCFLDGFCRLEEALGSGSNSGNGFDALISQSWGSNQHCGHNGRPGQHAVMLVLFDFRGGDDWNVFA